VRERELDQNSELFIQEISLGPERERERKRERKGECYGRDVG
jgi:hypothetical protein